MMEKLFNLGVNDKLKAFQIELVRSTNIMAFFFLLFAIILLLVLFFYQPSQITFCLVLLAPPILAWILNGLNLSILARPFFLISASLVITVLHAYFVLPGEELIFYFLYTQLNFFIVFWIIIDAREKTIIIPALIAMLAIFFSFSAIDSSFSSYIATPVLVSSTVKIIAVTINLLITFVALYTIQRRNINSEERMNKLKRELEEKSEGLEIKEKELTKTLNDISESHIEEDRRNWVAGGLTKINNILRSNDKDIYRKVLLGIIDHAGLLYGGIYEIEEEPYGDKFLVLRASYGFTKENIQKRRFPIDDGVVSRAYHERAIVHLTEIPAKFSKIESGLGEALPGTLVILPLIYEERIEGIIELASFRKLEEHVIEYFKRASVILARFIESYKYDTKTKELLEKTQQQTEEMRAQEEEMRQNMEELQATQEELHRKEKEYLSRIKKLEEQLGK